MPKEGFDTFFNKESLIVMKNISRNGIQAVVVRKDSYLCHATLPTFTLDGSTPFTIEVRFAYTKSNGGLLYSQENGIQIGFLDDIPYFEHPTLGRLDGTIDRKLEANGLMMVSVTYDGNDICLQINGIAVAKKVKQNLTPYQSSGVFFIGKDFDGFIEGVRVIKRALSDQEILKEYGIGFSETEDAVVFQTDFSTKQYKDIGPDNIGLWRTGTTAHCANVVTATKFESNSAYKRTNKLSFKEGFSVSIRFFPVFSQKKQTLYAIGNDNVIVSLSMEPNEENHFFLTVSSEGGTVISSKEISGLTWHDVVLSLDFDKKITSLYMDGEKVGDGKFDTNPMIETSSVIGSEYFLDKVRYKEGYAGLIDYVAEFSKVASTDEVERYIEHEPYFYDEGIASLLLFGWGEPRNALLGSNIAEYGNGFFTMIEDTCPLEAPRGAGWIVPEDEDETYWDSLSNNEKWALESFVKMANESIEGLTGIAMKDEDKGNKIVHRKYLGPEVQEVLDWANGEENDEIEALMSSETSAKDRTTLMYSFFSPEAMAGLRQRTINTQEIGVNSPLLAVGAAMTTGAASSVILTSEESAPLIAAYEVAVIALAIEILLIRPDNPNTSIHLEAASWNNQGKAEYGTIYFHCDEEKVTSMKWPKEGNDIEMQTVFVPSLLKNLVMQVNIFNAENVKVNSKLKMTGIDGSVSWSDVFEIKPKERKTINITHADIDKYRKDDTIHMSTGCYSVSYITNNKEKFICNIKYKYYTLLEKPAEPLELDEGNDYNPNNLFYVHTAVLDFMTKNSSESINLTQQNNRFRLIDSIAEPRPKSNIERDAAHRAIIALNNSHFTYDTNHGAPHYTGAPNSFYFLLFINHLMSGQQHVLNCTDCAFIMYYLCAYNGVHLPIIRLLPTTQDGFRCNRVQLITDPAISPPPGWVLPFGTGYFAFHAVNRTSNGAQYENDVGIYDACLKIDMGAYPSSNDPTIKNAQNPEALQAQNGIGDQVTINEPYHGHTYRERLVCNNESAVFGRQINNIVLTSPPIVFSYLNQKIKSMLEGKIQKNSRINILEYFMPRLNEHRWKLSYDGSEIDLIYYGWANTDKDIDCIMSQFTNPIRTKIKDEETGIEGFKVGDCCYVIKKDGKLYRIIGKNAWTIAKDII